VLAGALAGAVVGAAACGCAGVVAGGATLFGDSFWQAVKIAVRRKSRVDLHRFFLDTVHLQIEWPSILPAKCRKLKLYKSELGC